MQYWSDRTTEFLRFSIFPDYHEILSGRLTNLLCVRVDKRDMCPGNSMIERCSPDSSTIRMTVALPMAKNRPRTRPHSHVAKLNGIMWFNRAYRLPKPIPNRVHHRSGRREFVALQLAYWHQLGKCSRKR